MTLEYKSVLGSYQVTDVSSRELAEFAGAQSQFRLNQEGNRVLGPPSREPFTALDRSAIANTTILAGGS